MGGGWKDCSWSLITSYPESDTDPSLSMSWEATGPTIFRIKTKGKAPPVPSLALAYIPVKPCLKIQAVPAPEVWQTHHWAQDEKGNSWWQWWWCTQCWLVLMMIERLCERLRSVQSQDSGAAGGQPAVSPARVGRSAQCSPVNCYNRLTPPHLPDHRLRCY